ncbi:MAG: guanine nucleotide exchange protein for ADP-robosylation factor [Chaenotheca gracillima]|nr:MAG: guanine nucleotide exchange protein for ADP-robosylation factor [Chaenotheca gracillima]
MIIAEVATLVLEHWPIAALVLTLAFFLSNRYHNGLSKYPGPFLASLTNWWRFVDVWGRRPDITHIRLHRELGDIVRLGPNSLSFGDPRALKTIYGLNKGYTKSAFYPVQQATSGGKRLPSLFSTTDESYHAALRRSVNSAFSMSTLIQYEQFVDSTTEKFLEQTNSLYAATGATCDFATWLQFYAFDVIGELTYSKRHGFIERAEDVDGMVAYLGKLFSYVAPIGQIPMLDSLLLKNPVLRLLDRLGVSSFTFPVVKFAKARMAERMAEKEKGGTEYAHGRNDLLGKFLQAQIERPQFMDDGRVLTMAVSMAFAGSETTAISLSSVFYFLAKNPQCYKKLMDELNGALKSGQIEKRASGLVTWSESQQLPYLDACIKEAFRVHPAAGLPLERITPPGGAEILGEHIPGGTIVGCNAWVIHRRPEVFGEDVDAYRPERWLENSAEKLKEMNGTMFQFGMGARTCIGKNISLLEIYKLVPSFLLRFEVNLVHPEKEWKLHNAWFVKQLDFMTTFKQRAEPQAA